MGNFEVFFPGLRGLVSWSCGPFKIWVYSKSWKALSGDFYALCGSLSRFEVWKSLGLFKVWKSFIQSFDVGMTDIIKYLGSLFASMDVSVDSGPECFFLLA